MTPTDRLAALIAESTGDREAWHRAVDAVFDAPTSTDTEAR